MLVRALKQGLFLSAATLAATGAAMPLEIVNIGDSATQGVWADTEVGRAGPLFKSSLADALIRDKFFEALGQGASSIADPAARARYYSETYVHVRRPQLSVFLGDQPYSLPTRLANATGREIQLIGTPLLSGNYVEGWVQLDEIRETYRTDPRLTAPELVFVNFNGIDFNRKTPLPEFQDAIKSFYGTLAKMFPQTTIVATELFDSVSLVTEPDQFAFSFAGQDRTCSLNYREFGYGALYGLAPGVTGEVRDQAMAYQNEMNRLVAVEIAALNARQGAYANFRGRALVVGGFTPPGGLYRPFVAADCLHPNRDGMQHISQIIWDEMLTAGVVDALRE